MTTERIVIVGGPRTGKSWLAQAKRWGLSQVGGPQIPVFCGDPRSKVKEPLADVVYLPEGIPFAGDNGASQWVCDNWFTMDGPWICEGHVMARAIRRWMLTFEEFNDAGIRLPRRNPCDRIIVFENQRTDTPVSSGQESMHKGVMRVWSELADYYDAITEYR